MEFNPTKVINPTQFFSHVVTPGGQETRGDHETTFLFSHFLKVVKENLNYELLKYSFVCTASDFLSLIEISVLVISITNEVLGKQVMKGIKL